MYIALSSFAYACAITENGAEPPFISLLSSAHFKNPWNPPILRANASLEHLTTFWRYFWLRRKSSSCAIFPLEKRLSCVLMHLSSDQTSDAWLSSDSPMLQSIDQSRPPAPPKRPLTVLRLMRGGFFVSRFAFSLLFFCSAAASASFTVSSHGFRAETMLWIRRMWYIVEPSSCCAESSSVNSRFLAWSRAISRRERASKRKRCSLTTVLGSKQTRRRTVLWVRAKTFSRRLAGVTWPRMGVTRRVTRPQYASLQRESALSWLPVI
mmetsp:Transcript_3800/g.13442  ORF Transcript_3800/g.13442 Transcript_3800/m.13442 type:complete len:266 (-) Transcript_3800:458-1255(-)